MKVPRIFMPIQKVHHEVFKVYLLKTFCHLQPFGFGRTLSFSPLFQKKKNKLIFKWIPQTISIFFHFFANPKTYWLKLTKSLLFWRILHGKFKKQKRLAGGKRLEKAYVLLLFIFIYLLYFIVTPKFGFIEKSWNRRLFSRPRLRGLDAVSSLGHKVTVSAWLVDQSSV